MMKQVLSRIVQRQPVRVLQLRLQHYSQAIERVHFRGSSPQRLFDQIANLYKSGTPITQYELNKFLLICRRSRRHDLAVRLLTHNGQSGSYRLFMNQQNVNVMLSILADRSERVLAEKLFHSMEQERGFAPDSFSLVAMLRLYTTMGDITAAEGIFHELHSSSFDMPMSLTEDMMGMYARAGRMDRCLDMLPSLKGAKAPTAVTLNKVLTGLSKRKPFSALRSMHAQLTAVGLPSDGVTYNILLGSLHRSAKTMTRTQVREAVQSVLWERLQALSLDSGEGPGAVLVVRDGSTLDRVVNVFAQKLDLDAILPYLQESFDAAVQQSDCSSSTGTAALRPRSGWGSTGAGAGLLIPMHRLVKLVDAIPPSQLEVGSHLVLKEVLRQARALGWRHTTGAVAETCVDDEAVWQRLGCIIGRVLYRCGVAGDCMAAWGVLQYAVGDDAGGTTRSGDPIVGPGAVEGRGPAPAWPKDKLQQWEYHGLVSCFRASLFQRVHTLCASPSVSGSALAHRMDSASSASDSDSDKEGGKRHSESSGVEAVPAQLGEEWPMCLPADERMPRVRSAASVSRHIAELMSSLRTASSDDLSATDTPMQACLDLITGCSRGPQYWTGLLGPGLSPPRLLHGVDSVGVDWTPQVQEWLPGLYHTDSAIALRTMQQITAAVTTGDLFQPTGGGSQWYGVGGDSDGDGPVGAGLKVSTAGIEMTGPGANQVGGEWDILADPSLVARRLTPVLMQEVLYACRTPELVNAGIQLFRAHNRRYGIETAPLTVLDTLLAVAAAWGSPRELRRIDVILDEAFAAGLLRGLPAEAADVRRRIQLFDAAVQRIAANAEAMGSLHHGLLPLTRSSPPSKTHRRPSPRSPEVGSRSARRSTRSSAEEAGAINASGCNSTATAIHQPTSSRSTALTLDCRLFAPAAIPLVLRRYMYHLREALAEVVEDPGREPCNLPPSLILRCSVSNKAHVANALLLQDPALNTPHALLKSYTPITGVDSENSTELLVDASAVGQWVAGVAGNTSAARHLARVGNVDDDAHGTGDLEIAASMCQADLEADMTLVRAQWVV